MAHATKTPRSAAAPNAKLSDSDASPSGLGGDGGGGRGGGISTARGTDETSSSE
eukprot:CAMPEP_0174722284 /NCGR_PEP_ID=MMETSP1094-20130205/38078_1 /TAXON_ID=156173 /ORGANISM="Chrysochromulina brevifilum, Strain UTEX LB 985" /LENGTH=53 /DNA_ID=CAMNT_0015923113 /DNA_START=645 /DNA_END=806 /DNA_ORIENTATION=-